MSSKPGPDSAWTSPPSWLAAMRKGTPPVDAWVTCFWMAWVMCSMPVTPTVESTAKVMDPKWKRAMASAVTAGRLLPMAIMKSCPMRCSSLIEASVMLAQSVATGVTGVDVGVARGATTELPQALATAGLEATSSAASTTVSRPPTRRSRSRNVMQLALIRYVVSDSVSEPPRLRSGARSQLSRDDGASRPGR